MSSESGRAIDATQAARQRRSYADCLAFSTSQRLDRRTAAPARRHTTRGPAGRIDARGTRETSTTPTSDRFVLALARQAVPMLIIHGVHDPQAPIEADRLCPRLVPDSHACASSCET